MSIANVEVDDVFADWKRNRFIVTDLSDTADCILVVLTDISFWSDNYEPLYEWAQEHGCRVVGMTVNIPNEETLTWFTIRWS